MLFFSFFFVVENTDKQIVDLINIRVSNVFPGRIRELLNEQPFVTQSGLLDKENSLERNARDTTRWDEIAL